MTPSSVRTLAAGAFVAALTAAIVAGVILMDPPSTARELRLDERRVQDLRTISQLVDTAYVRDTALLPSLEQLDSSGLRGALLTDPETGAPYEYFVKDDNRRYELCATFDRASPAEDAFDPSGDWVHPAGRHCFTLRAAQSDPARSDPARPGAVESEPPRPAEPARSEEPVPPG